VLDRSLDDFLQNRLGGKSTRRSNCYDEAGFEEEFGSRKRKRAAATPGVTSDRLRVDVNGRVRWPRGALWSDLGGRVSA
jgi:hypothetical protein